MAQRLFHRKKTISLAESCTGGLLGHRLTNISGSSKYFKVGLVTYSYESKERLLRISHRILLKYGAVSKPVTKLMAENARKILDTDFGIGITGIAGPTGATKTKPVGLTYIALATRTKTLCQKYIFKGTRGSVKKQAAEGALKLLLQSLR